MRVPFDRDYYVMREEAERLAALRTESAARRAHLDLAELYAVRLREARDGQLQDG